MFACTKPQMTMAGSKKASRKTDRGLYRHEAGTGQFISGVSPRCDDDVVLHF